MRKLNICSSRTTKFDEKMQKTLAKIPINLAILGLIDLDLEGQISI